MTESLATITELIRRHADQLRTLGAIIDIRDPVTEGAALVVRVEMCGKVGDLLVWPNGHVSRVVLDGPDFVFEDDRHYGLPALDEIDEFFRMFV